MAVTVRELVERRVPHFLAVYLGAGWGMIEFIRFLEERFDISPLWTNLGFFAWMLLIPSVLLYTWNHGRPGRDAWVRSEKVAIPLNVVITIAVLTTAFGGKDLGATMRKVTVTDENGAQVERVVPKSSFLKRVALFWFDVPANDTSQLWLREGAALGLNADLLQDMFVDVRTPQHFREQLREAGISDGNNVPLSLKQKVAQELHLPYFVAGRVSRDADGYTINTTLYETASMREVNSRMVTDPDLLTAIDKISVQLRVDLEIPTQPHAAATVDLPVAELLSNNMDAVRAMSAAIAALMRDDRQAGEALFVRATTLDPTFALAHLQLYQTRAMNGDVQAGLPHLAKALQHEYRLPERLRMLTKVDNFLMQQEKDKALAVATNMVELYPNDILGHQISAQLYIFRKEEAKAVTSLRKVLELDPQQDEMLLAIGELQEYLEQPQEALKTYVEYSERNPSDAEGLMRAARVQHRQGQLAEARATFERALAADPTNVAPKLAFATYYRDIGDLDNSLRQLQQSLGSVTNAADSMRTLDELKAHYASMGRMREAVATLEKVIPIAARIQIPMQAFGIEMGNLDLLVHAGQRGEAEAKLARIRGLLTPPFDELWQLGALVIAAETDDSVRLATARAAVQRLVDGFGFTHMSAMVVTADAKLLELRGDWLGAANKYRELKRLEPTSTKVNRQIARALRNAGRIDEAQQAIDVSLRAAPYGPETNLEAARIRIAKNDAAGAREHLERAQRMLAHADPGYQTAEDVKKLMAEIGAR